MPCETFFWPDSRREATHSRRAVQLKPLGGGLERLGLKKMPGRPLESKAWFPAPEYQVVVYRPRWSYLYDVYVWYPIGSKGWFTKRKLRKMGWDRLPDADTIEYETLTEAEMKRAFGEAFPTRWRRDWRPTPEVTGLSLQQSDPLRGPVQHVGPHFPPSKGGKGDDAGREREMDDVYRTRWRPNPRQQPKVRGPHRPPPRRKERDEEGWGTTLGSRSRTRRRFAEATSSPPKTPQQPESSAYPGADNFDPQQAQSIIGDVAENIRQFLANKLKARPPGLQTKPGDDQTLTVVADNPDQGVGLEVEIRLLRKAPPALSPDLMGGFGIGPAPPTPAPTPPTGPPMGSSPSPIGMSPGGGAGGFGIGPPPVF